MWMSILIMIGFLVASGLAGVIVYNLLKLQADIADRRQFDWKLNTEAAARMEAARYGLDVVRVNPPTPSSRRGIARRH